MTNTEFNNLIKGTKLGKSGQGQLSLDAARLYFVSNAGNVAECARKAGCSAQSARVTINRVKELIDQQGMEAVTVLVPKGQAKKIEKLAEKLAREG